MASASPTDDRSAREHLNRSGEAFEPFDGGTNTLAEPKTRGRKPRRARTRRGLHRPGLDGTCGR